MTRKAKTKEEKNGGAIRGTEFRRLADRQRASRKHGRSEGRQSKVALAFDSAS